jgi:hypothetical protein
MSTTVTPVPYDIGFQLYAYVKFEEDGQKIIEQILPFFHPDMTLSIELVPNINIRRDIPLVLQGVNLEDKYEGSFIDLPVKIWTLTFVMKAYLYGPQVDRPLIKFVNVQAWGQGNAAAAAEANTGPGFVSNTFPGLDANGNPTSDITIAIDPLLVNINDNWGVINFFTDRVEQAAGSLGALSFSSTLLEGSGLTSEIDVLADGDLSAGFDGVALTANGTVV